MHPVYDRARSLKTGCSHALSYRNFSALSPENKSAVFRGRRSCPDIPAMRFLSLPLMEMPYSGFGYFAGLHGFRLFPLPAGIGANRQSSVPGRAMTYKARSLKGSRESCIFFTANASCLWQFCTQTALYRRVLSHKVPLKDEKLWEDTLKKADKRDRKKTGSGLYSPG